MELISFLLAIFILIFLKVWVTHQWAQWRGAYMRWKKGEPLRLLDTQLLRHREERTRLEQERRKIRAAYEIQSARILNKEFRKRFIELGIGEQIRDEVKHRHGMVYACCGCKILSTKNRHVDHLKPLKLYPELEFLHTNLQILCRTCNVHKSAYDGDDWKEVVAARSKQTLKTKRRRKAREAA